MQTGSPFGMNVPCKCSAMNSSRRSSPSRKGLYTHTVPAEGLQPDQLLLGILIITAHRNIHRFSSVFRFQPTGHHATANLPKRRLDIQEFTDIICS